MVGHTLCILWYIKNHLGVWTEILCSVAQGSSFLAPMEAVIFNQGICNKQLIPRFPFFCIFLLIFVLFIFFFNIVEEKKTNKMYQI